MVLMEDMPEANWPCGAACGTTGATVEAAQTQNAFEVNRRKGADENKTPKFPLKIWIFVSR